MNLQKTKLVCFGCTVKDVPVAGGTSVQNFPLSKFLGLLIDNELKYEDHITNLANKVSSGCFAVRVTVQELGTRVGRTVYFALIESRLRYAICFWGNSSNHLLQTLFVLQKRALRCICGVGSRDSCRILFPREKGPYPDMYLYRGNCPSHF